MKRVKKLAIKICGGLAYKYSKYFKSLKRPLVQSDLKILFKTYVSMIFFTSILSFLAGFIFFVILFSFMFPALFNIFLSFTLAVTVAVVIFTLFYLYPLQRSKSRANSIDANLPFAINHMSAIATSGVPSTTLFRLLTHFKEYGEISKEASKIVRGVDVFGQDLTTSLRQVSSSNPSKKFSEVLEGIIAVVRTGGNLKDYLKIQADEAMFNYRMRRERYMQTLSTYADFYTAVLIAAPLFLVALLAIMNMIGGQVMGMDIPTVMRLGIFLVIPVTNIIFIFFIHITQPKEI